MVTVLYVIVHVDLCVSWLSLSVSSSDLVLLLEDMLSSSIRKTKPLESARDKYCNELLVNISKDLNNKHLLQGLAG